jgi:hypothetical protein
MSCPYWIYYVHAEMKWHKMKHLSVLLQIDIFMQYTVFHDFCMLNMNL